MKRFLSILFILILIIAVFTINSKKKVKIQEPIFIGHVYGDHDNSDIPYIPLKKVISKNNLDFNGGDITKVIKFYVFDNFHISTNFILKVIMIVIFIIKQNFGKKNLLNLINLSNKISEIYNFNFNNYNNTFFISHYTVEKFSSLKPSNQFLGKKNSLKFDNKNNFGKGNKFISGDCGKYTDKSPYILARYNDNYFLCTGLGQSSNNFVILPTLEPIFFNEDGEIIKHKCKEIKFEERILKVCSTKKKHLVNLN